MKFRVFPVLLVASALACEEEPIPSMDAGRPVETVNSSPGFVDAGQTSSAEAGVGEGAFILWSPAFDDGASLPYQYTCEGNPFGGGHSPSLRWNGAPTGTLSFALVFKDLTLSDQPQFAYHWAAWNIPSNVSSIPERLASGQFPDALAGGEQFRAGPPLANEFFGPCPSWGAHCFGEERSNDEYAFILYAFEDAALSPPEPREGENYVAILDAYFAAAATAITSLHAQSDAAPSSAPMCPDDGGAGDISDAGDAAASTEDSRVRDAGRGSLATSDLDAAAPSSRDSASHDHSTDDTCSTHDSPKRGKRHRHPRHGRH